MYHRRQFILRLSLGFQVRAFLRWAQDGRGGSHPPAAWQVVVSRPPSEGHLPPLAPRLLPELVVALCRPLLPRRVRPVVQRRPSLVLVVLAAEPYRLVEVDGAA